MTEGRERRRLLGWIVALLALPALAACDSGGMSGRRRSDDAEGEGGGMGGDSGGGAGGGY